MKTGRFTSTIIQNVGKMSTSANSAPRIEEQKVNVNGVNVNYIKTGVGKHPVLLLPGSMGSIWTDFKPQIENLNREKLTIIAWDPPGYGKSRPPDRTFPENFFRRDATWACNLMKILGYDEFSLLGWSDGGITSLILAAKYPESIRRMIVTGVNSYILSEEIKTYENLRDISTWSERMKAPPITLYGEEYLQRVWENWVDARKYIFYNNGGDICKGDLVKIRCSTLIVYGGKDPVVLQEHADYLKTNIKHSKVEFFEAGAHNLHLRYADEFNLLANKFLIE